MMAMAPYKPDDSLSTVVLPGIMSTYSSATVA
jgi:hypothetical protein